MAGTAVGGGSGAVAASAHAACARFRGTDPLIVGRTRRALATDVGFPDDSGRIPEARWMRAMTFERLVHGERFASELATTTVGRLGLARPTEVVTVNAHVRVTTTAALLEAAHERATATGSATLIHGLAVPFVGFAEGATTDVKPDFAVVAPTAPPSAGSWLVIGDAKDYERVRSRIEDTRLLKGFLQVALGAESAASWSRLPPAMAVHSHGVLAAPRNAFLQPEALVDLLDDHRAEVRMRVEERRAEAAGSVYDEFPTLAAYIAHLRATYDPTTCTTCTLYSYCRNELRTSKDPDDLLVELGISAVERPHLVGLIDGTGNVGPAPASAIANVQATLDGVGRSTGQRRTDQAGQPGTINVALVKSDAAALGVHGIALQRVTADGRDAWRTTVFDDPQSQQTRLRVMRLLGAELVRAMSGQRRANRDAPSPVHVVVPDASTADVLASIADNLAGIELSRLRWNRDREMGREPLTFNGEPAQVPPPLPEEARTAVSFLLEEDRARALTLRSPLIDVRAALARHLIAGGPPVASLRLDYLTAWAGPEPVDPRRIEDHVEDSASTPGARLGNRRSDAIHRALAGTRSTPADPERYAALVADELGYKCEVLERALDVLGEVPDSALREVYEAIEGDAQGVWRRRLTLHASDLVRFGRTYRHWRNSLVPVIESDDRCHAQLLAMASPQVAQDLAADAGVRDVALATVVSTSPLELDMASRRIGDGSRIVLLHVGDDACVEGAAVTLKAQATSFSFGGLSIGPLTATGVPRRLQWSPSTAPQLAVGDRLVVADFAWFSDAKRNTALAVKRPSADQVSAPKVTCEHDSYANDPGAHQYCCRPHEDAEADWSDQLAVRRANGELNPEVWPPVVDGDAFEVSPAGAPLGDAADEPSTTPPNNLTMDDLE